MNIGGKTKTIILFLQIILNHITTYLKLERVAYNNKEDNTYFILLNRFPDLIASINSLLNQILIVPLHEVHMQYGSRKEHLYTRNRTNNDRL